MFDNTVPYRFSYLDSLSLRHIIPQYYLHIYTHLHEAGYWCNNVEVMVVYSVKINGAYVGVIYGTRIHITYMRYLHMLFNNEEERWGNIITVNSVTRQLNDRQHMTVSY